MVGLIIFLLSGMRRFSLSDKQRGRAPVFPAAQATPQKDWLKFLVFLELYWCVCELVGMVVRVLSLGDLDPQSSSHALIVMGIANDAVMIVLYLVSPTK